MALLNPIDARDLKAADATLAARQRPWADGLSVDEQAALRRYKGAAGRLMNEALRGDTGDAAALAQAAPLRAALARAAAPADMVLHRGVGSAEAALYRARIRGDVVRARAFVSTSVSLGVATIIARHEAGTVVDIPVRRRQKGVAYVHPFPTYRYPQYEVLLNTGTRLRVLQADAEVIRLEVVDDDHVE